MSEKEIRDSIQIDNFRYIDGKNLKMVFAEKHGEAILYGEEIDGTRYTLAVIAIPKEHTKK